MKRWILIAAVLGSGIVFLDSTVVNVALPRIGRDLPRLFLGVLEGQSYVYNAYLLTLSALLILAGAINDYYGRKLTFLIGLVAFGVTSALCGFAPNMELLVLFRVLQGAAGALLVPGSLALITANFSGEEQGRAFGTWAGASGATTILGPLLGGLLVDTISWRAAFFINVPLVAVAAWATWVHVPESRDHEGTPRFDWIGAALVAFAVGGLAFGTIYGQQRAWRDPVGYTAAAAGAGGIPGSIFLIFFSRRFGSLAARYGPRIFMAVGPVIMAAGVLWFARVPASSTPWKLDPGNVGTYLPPLSYFIDFLPGNIVFGVGIMILVAPLTTALMTSVPVRHSGLGSAINNAISRVGPQLAGALIFVFLTANFYSILASRLSGVDVNSESFRNSVSPLNTPTDASLVAVVRDASTSSFHLAMLIGAALLLLGAAVNAVGIQNRLPSREAADIKEPVPAASA